MDKGEDGEMEKWMEGADEEAAVGCNETGVMATRWRQRLLQR